MKTFLGNIGYLLMVLLVAALITYFVPQCVSDAIIIVLLIICIGLFSYLIKE